MYNNFILWQKRFAEYVMRGRKEAVIIALICTLFPLMGWLGIVIMALITLRKGALEGLLILFWIALPFVILAFLGDPQPLMYSVLCGSLVAWVLALLLRETSSWKLVLQAAMLVGIVGVLLVHAFTTNTVAYWSVEIKNIFTQMKSNYGLQLRPADLDNLSKFIAPMWTGIQAIALLFVSLVNIMIARWLQSLLYHPGGLRQEVYNLRLGITAVLALSAVLIALFAGISIAWDVLPLVLGLFFVTGLSLTHAAVSSTKNVVTLLIGFYGLLILFFPYVAIVLVVIALADTWFNFRGYLNVGEKRFIA